MLDVLCPMSAFFGVICLLALVVGFFLASKDRRRFQLGVALAVSAVFGLVIGFSVVFWDYVRHANSIGDAFEAISENLRFELSWGNGIQRILAATAGSMLVSWLSHAMFRKLTNSPGPSGSSEDQTDPPKE
jgi:hypothetical protein